jgi:quinol monooxygenase YgiN
MKTVILTHEIKNYPEWRKVFDADEANRAKAGLQISAVYHSVDNPNMITMIGVAPSMEALTTFMSNPELKAAMEKAGVIGIPEVKILNKL